MAKESNKTPKTSKSSTLSRLGRDMFFFKEFEAEKSFASFLLIYIVVAWLFLGRGVLEETILVLFTGVMVGAAFYLIFKFVKYLAKAADSRDGKFGSLLVVYILNLLVPLIGLRLFGYTLISILPRNHEGLPKLLCDLFNLFEDLYWGVFEVPQTLDFLMMGSLVLFGLLSVISVILPKKS